jgi:hypothetical protein
LYIEISEEIAMNNQIEGKKTKAYRLAIVDAVSDNRDDLIAQISTQYNISVDTVKKDYKKVAERYAEGEAY